MIKKLIFDLDNTLIIWKDEYSLELKYLLEEYKIDTCYKKVDKIIDDLRHTYVQGLTILGGEPFLNTQVAISLAKRVREEFGYEKDIWVYSGYTYEQLLNGSEDKKELLSLCDVLVDGPFMIFLKDLSLRFRGSSNQRIIDLKKSTRENVVLYLE